MTQILVWLNALANACGSALLAPVAYLPGWLSLLISAAVCGVVMLIVFKHTSNQAAIKRVRSTIKANLLALSLFKDNTRVCLQAQVAMLGAALRLLLFAVVPMLVMIVPTCLILGQLALWYQARPLRVGEEAVLTMQLSGPLEADWPAVSLDASPACEATIGPVRVQSRRMVCWNLLAKEPGDHRLVFHVGDDTITKQLAIGDGLMRVSLERPGWRWADILLHPWEAPFAESDAVASITIDYPQRSGWIVGSQTWLISWFVISMVAAFALRRTFNVNL